MTITETLLTFVGAPAALFAVISLAAIGPSQMRAPARYRPGRAWPHEPAWFLPHAGAPASAAGHGEISGGHGEIASAQSASSSNTGPVGGASGEW